MTALTDSPLSHESSELVRVGRRLRVSEDSWSIALLQLIHHSFRSACPTQSPTKILSGTQTHTHCTSRHILRNVAIFSPTRAWVNNLQSVISQYSSSLNKQIPNPMIWVNPVIPSKSFVMQGQTNSCFLVNKAQSTGWAYSMNVRIADEKGTLRGRWISP